MVSVGPRAPGVKRASADRSPRPLPRKTVCRAAVAGSTVPGVIDDDGYFGEPIAARYDATSADMFRPEAVDPAIDLLAELAGDGAALELGVGTGRIALPLAARGVPVHGVDMSRAMVARLRAKPGGDAVGVTIGDFATTRVPGEFAVAYLVFNTINNLTTQDAQVDCFVNVAAHLRPGGCFVVEVGVPELRLLPPGQNAVPFRISDSGWAFDVLDPATQAMSSNYVTIVDGRAEHRSIPFRYVWPAELDLMARLAGLRLRNRWEDWNRTPFTGESRTHVSVWEKPAF
ncbi:class I SAM-dependent methyltransferase [Streptomyces viridochromogenes]